MMNWRSAESDEAKTRMMWAAWGDRPPDYCYYHLPDGVVVDNTYVVATFFPRHPKNGSRETHRSDRLDGSGLVRVKPPEPYTVLRIRDSEVMPPPAITMNGVRCPLIQFGYGSNEKMGADGTTPLTINFIKLWGWTA